MSESIGVVQDAPITSVVGYPRLQIIDEDKQFSEDVNSYLDKIGLLDSGMNYHLISVFGSQSTGKSTLLNALFGTKFDVMDETARRQTTKGIWMSRAKQDRILIMDVEGTDGRERGEDQDFERKAALFALSTSEVLIVNIWEHQVGLYQGANMGLLKTVFEVNLSLFSKPNKSLLLFVIRDHIGVTPLENLAATLSADLERIWDSLIKPPALADSKITDFFTLQFTTLPHKILQPEQFFTAVDQLGNRFIADAKDTNYVFDPKFHRNVPADGWSIYAKSIWEQIELNKDLDLPTQQVLVARFRCEEIAGQAWEAFEAAIKPVEGMAGVVAGLGAIIGPARSKALEVYESQASRYTTSVYEEKKKELVSKIDLRLVQLYAAQIINLKKIAVQKFSADVTAELAKPKYKFLEAVGTAKRETMTIFEAAAAEALVEGTSLSYEKDLAALSADLEANISRLREGESKRLANRITRVVASELDESLPSIFRSPGEDMWDRVMLDFRETVATALAKYEVTNEEGETKYDFGLGGLPEEVSAEIDQVLMDAWKVLHRKIREFGKAEAVLLRLREIFETKFKYDEKGVPRVWKPSDNIEEVYTTALNETMELIPVMTSAKLANGDPVAPDAAIIPVLERDEEIDVEKFSVFMSRTQTEELRQSFKRIAVSMYVDAKRSTIQSIRQIPLYFYILLLVLGWNEIVAVLRNPLYFALLAIMAGGAYVTYSLGLLGPITSVGGAALDQALAMGKEKLREVLLSAEQPHGHATAVSGNRTAIAEPGTLKDDIKLDDLSASGKTLETSKERSAPGGF
ncbi:RHD3/Sey1 [Myxozyma melibiosi]|uniref:RHD3/Sey1 n=1 Tax=Myxozyma melibiosi TaxID=54550 RepID=A0ABR1FC51_9ASCO